MLTLAEACKPRPSVFDATARDSVHDLADLLDGRVDAKAFFEESHATEGQQLLIEQAFRRFAAMDAHAVFQLSQSMGGGKTHSMIALGLLARHPELRAAHGGAGASAKVGRVRVIGFTGRDTDAPFGVWGALASQLGKKELFEPHYAPLSAPGPKAWTELLRGDPVLILLDELPPYFHAAKAREVGHTDLAEVTTAALGNLFVAVQRRELDNVAVVVSDLDGRNYGAGHDHMLKALENLRDEAGRTALNIQPVRPNNDELYSILRRRLFSELPPTEAIEAVARGFQKAMKDAKEMGIVSDSPEAFAEQIRDSYPFHPSLRDLYARFKENPGFQQTRGILRLMRALVGRLFRPEGRAGVRHLVAPFDLDLNDRETLSQIQVVHSALTNAIAHDVASGGAAVAEKIDGRRSGSDATDTATHLLVASLANVPNATLGLTETELVRDLVAPGRDVRAIPREVVAALGSEAWYLHQGAQGRLFFKDTENIVAKLRTYARGYAPEVVMGELRRRLSEGFTPRRSDCYQKLAVLPALDTVEVKNDQVVLVVLRPAPAGGLPDDVKRFWETLDHKNRIAFLTGDRDVTDTMLDLAAQGRAIDTIIEELAATVPEHDPQRQEATRQRERLAVRLRSAVREGFTALYYPSVAESRQGQKTPQLRRADVSLEFTSNEWSGEATIRTTLMDKQKLSLLTEPWVTTATQASGTTPRA